ncbi:hypothetical protein IPH67_01495 [bacterium]|nr:MAG: hypothetical protein IPH67_01495 [bacterium]
MKYLLSIFFCFFSFIVLFSHEQTPLSEEHSANLKTEALQNISELITTLEAQKTKEITIKQFFQKHNLIALIKVVEQRENDYNKAIKIFTSEISTIEKHTDEDCKNLIKMAKITKITLDNQLIQMDFLLRPASLYQFLLNHENGYKKNKPHSVQELKEFMNLKIKTASEVKSLERRIKEIEKTPNELINKTKENDLHIALDSALSLEKIEESRKESKNTIKTLGLPHYDGGNTEFLKRILTIAENLGLDTQLIVFTITSGNENQPLGIRPVIIPTEDESNKLRCVLNLISRA